MENTVILMVDIPTAPDELKTNFHRSLKQEIMQVSEPGDLSELKEETPLPKGAMSAEAFTLGGALILAVLPTLLPKIAEIIKDFKLRNNHHQMKVMVKNGDKEISIELPAGTEFKDIEELTALLMKKIH